MTKSIVVKVSPDGETNIEAVGFSDSSCVKATEWLEKALGKVQKRKMVQNQVQQQEVKQQ